MDIQITGDASILTVGLRDEYNSCQKDGTPAEIYLVTSDDNTVIVLWLPSEGRAGLSSKIGTGDDQWTDAKSVEHAVSLYLSGEMNP